MLTPFQVMESNVICTLFENTNPSSVYLHNYNRGMILMSRYGFVIKYCRIKITNSNLISGDGHKHTIMLNNCMYIKH